MFSSPSIIRIIVSRKIGWAIHVARITGEKCTKFGAETLNREHPDVNWRVILIRVLKEMPLGVWTGSRNNVGLL